MKRITFSSTNVCELILMLLLVCSTYTTANAQSKKRVTSATPNRVVTRLNSISEAFGDRSNQQYSVFKNPNTGLIESRIKTIRFDVQESYINLEEISEAFIADEPVSYQILHILPNETTTFTIGMPTSNPKKVKDTIIRNSAGHEELWYMATKNPDNPQLRDINAICWRKNSGRVIGKIYMITSFRPDLLGWETEREVEKHRNIFRLDGRMGSDNTDSLYVFYMADTYDELNQLTTRTDSYDELLNMADNEHVFYMPVVDKRFELCVEIDKRMAGRIRTKMPDGSLCKLWTNIDMVPGETYHITTHNGWYESDVTYENKFGLYSGKSMFAGHDNDDIEITGGYEDEITSQPNFEQFDTVLYEINVVPEPQRTQLQLLWDTYKQKKQILVLYQETIYLGLSSLSNTQILNYLNIYDSTFEQISKESVQLDNLLRDIVSFMTKNNMPESLINFLYQDFIEFLCKQNKISIGLYNTTGQLSHATKKCQKTISKLTKKYIDKVNALKDNKHAPSTD